MDIILGASIIASFLAGMVALFAPCCIGFIFPAYMASVFKKKTKIIRMTLVFFAGIAVILIPIGLGAAWLAGFFRDFHKEMYLIGGLFMVVLAVMAILSKSLTLFPGLKSKIGGSTLKSGQTGEALGSKSVFSLGVLSGAATSCCAPVLAGAMTLAVISGAFWKALIVVFAYVLGMVFPLFIAAYFYDTFKLENTKIIKGKLVELKLGAKKIIVHTTNLISAVVFLLMGAVLIFMALSGNTFWAPEFQVRISELLNSISQNLANKLSIVPDVIWGVITIGFFLFFVIKAGKRSKK
ncbi:MAG: cytochrome c biogenesis protein CcdA [Candidatus Spechtbacterales bacterium]